MTKLLNSAYELIGYSPIVRLDNYAKSLGLTKTLYAKLEYFSLAGSIKDKVAYQMICDLENANEITKNSTLIEPTSGNTGVGVSAVGAIKGYKVIIVMPENLSVEKQKIMRAYGAQVVLTDAKLGMQGAIDKAKELNNSIKDSVILGQFTNRSNVKAHYVTTGKEILNSMPNLNYFVAGIGTGGTISGTGKYLKENLTNVQVVGVEPLSSPLITKGQVGSHKIQGIGANFVPELLDMSVIDKVIAVSDSEAYEAVQKVAKLEGLLIGISGGANLVAATKILKEYPESQVLFIVADSGERYLSTDLFI